VFEAKIVSRLRLIDTLEIVTD